jgi:hypothetical protein
MQTTNFKITIWCRTSDNLLADLGPQQDRKLWPLWELRLSSLHGVLHGNTRMPYGYLIEVFGEFCNEISGCTPTKVWLHNNWVKEAVKPVHHCVGNSFRTFPVQLFCYLRTRHISTFQAQSTNNISVTCLTITVGNFSNGHSTTPRLLCGVPFF